MSNYTFLQKIALGGVFFLGFNSAFANKHDFTVCPSVDDLKTFKFAVSVPYGFDNSTKSVKLIMLGDKVSPTDTQEAPNDNGNGMALVMYPVMVGVGENAEKIRDELVGKLQLETTTPLAFGVVEDMRVNVCVYVLPGNDQLNTLVFLENEDTFDPTFVKMGNSNDKHQRHIRMIKRFIMN